MTNIETNNAPSIFREPYRSWSPEKLLSHFQNRTDLHYFSVIDEAETSREKIDNILLNRFEFNHESYQLPEDFDWTDNPSPDIEWSILLHKFYYSVGLGMAYHETKDQRYFQKWIDLTSSWINTVSPGFLSSDVAGRRIQNWIYAHYYFVTLNPTLKLPEIFYMNFLKSIHDQVTHLAYHLTPARNHRTLELTTMFLAAVVFPELSGADMWFAFAKEELLKNIQKDILTDGVHCELSTDYHHIVLKNYLNIRKLAALNRISLPEEMDIQIMKALEFSLYVHKPDGFIPSLSDGDAGCYLDLLEEGHRLYRSEEMVYVSSKGKLGHPPLERSKGFFESGYVILRSGWGNGGEPYEDERYLVFDCGPLGAGNHGHLDLLSFEMAAYGQSLIVDPGRYTYDESGDTNWRVRFRGTAYHNTVLVDQKNQTAYRPGKRKYKLKGPEPDYELKSFAMHPGFDYLHGIARSHEYDAVHERKIFFACPDYWLVSDLLLSEQFHDYDLLFHLSDQAFQNISVAVESGTLMIRSPHLVIAQAHQAEAKLQVEDGYISRSYGKKHRAPVLRFSRHATNASFHTVLYPYKNQQPAISIIEMPVTSVLERPGANLSSALCVTTVKNGKKFRDTFFTTQNDTGGEYRFEDLLYNGRFLFVRRDSEGKVLHAQGSTGAALFVSGKPIKMNGNGP